MEVKQIYSLVNQAVASMTGVNATLPTEDLSNLVDVGRSIFDANAYENFTKSLVDVIGKTIFVTRKYNGASPKVYMDSWEFGSVMQKIRGEMPDAVENESWELEDGASYDENIFYRPQVSVKFFNSKTTFEIDQSITDLQVRSAFTSIQALNSFLDMLFNEVEKKLTIAMDGLIMRVIDNFIGETLYAEYGGSAYSSKSTSKAVNILYLYKQVFTGSTLTASDCLYDKDFLRFSTTLIKRYIARLQVATKIYNIGETTKFTPRDLLHVVLHADYVAQVTSVLQSDTFHDELVKLPLYEEVAYWQGTGSDFEWSSTSAVKITTSGNHSINADGIIGVMFDRDALGVTNYNRRTPVKYNGKGEFTNYFHKQDASFFNDFDEQFVVFFVA